jgi:hypothetical protein
LTLPYTVDTDTPFHPVDMPCHFEDGEVLSVAEYTPDVERELLLHMLEAANADPRGTADLIQSRPDKYAPWVGAINEARAAVGAVAGIFRPPAVGALTSALDGGHGISAADGR